jgi:methionyl-tRNA synthetase
VASQYNGVLPDAGDPSGPFTLDESPDREFIKSVNSLLKEYIVAMDAVKLRLGLQTVMLISIQGNQYLQSSGLNKTLMAEHPKRCAQVISRAINLIYALSALIYPFMPSTSESILVQLNAPARTVPEVLSNDILHGHTIGKPEHLFKKIDESMADTWRVKFGGIEGKTVPADDPLKAEPGKSKKGAGGKKASAKPDAIPDGPAPTKLLH